MARSQTPPIVFVLLGLIVAGMAALLFARRTAPTPRMTMPADEAWTLSNAIDINVYVDGSGSIRNFLEGANRKSVQTNYLEGLLDKSETTLHHAPSAGGWQTKRLRFWRFGTDVKELPSETGLQQLSQNPGTFNERSTRIETPIRHNPGAVSGEQHAELKIIITDLYQSGGEIARPSDALADKYLTNDSDAVGILAVRNTFQGDVEDLPGTPPGGTLKDAATSMPFYVIFAGPAPDVRHGMETLIRGTGLDEAIEKKLAMELFFTRKPAATREVTPVLTGKGYSLMDRSYQGSRIPAVVLSSGTLMAQWQGTAVGGVVLEEGSKMQATVKHFDGNGAGVDDAQAALAATDCPMLRAPCAVIDRTPLVKRTWYQFRFDQVASEPSPVFRPGGALLKNWNIEVPEAEQISRSRRPQFPADAVLGGYPGKTPKLSEFLMALQGQMFHAPITLASYYLYVQAD